MTVEPLVPDAPPLAAAPPQSGDLSTFTAALDALGSVLDGAQSAEDAFARGAGTLQDAVFERAQADVALFVATAAAQRGAQAITSIMNMQV
jgi:flagellar hook-basal body complex protein FliE